MTILKKLTNLAVKTSAPEGESTDNGESRERKLTYFESGYGEAKNANGNATIFSSCLEAVFQDFKERCRQNDEEQIRLTAPYRAEGESLKTQIAQRQTAREIKSKHLEENEGEIQKIERDISNVRTDPHKYGVDADKKPQAQFYIGLLVLLPITIYLLVFYMSASYSAFFKVFENSELSAAIFDGNAFTKAMNDGLLEAIFVGTIPFVFMGLGYLIHMFLKEPKGAAIKTSALFVVAFIFDSILAYLIEKKIYDFERTLTSANFDLSIAFRSVEFWGIIFAGFVVYIIWGLVFDFVMKEHENIDKIKLFVQSLKEKKEMLIQDGVKLKEEIREIDSKLVETEGKLREIQSKIDGFVFPNRKYKVYHTEYVKGWFLAISKEIALPTKEKDQMIELCRLAAQNHLVKNGILTDENENLVYTKEL